MESKKTDRSCTYWLHRTCQCLRIFDCLQRCQISLNGLEDYCSTKGTFAEEPRLKLGHTTAGASSKIRYIVGNLPSEVRQIACIAIYLYCALVLLYPQSSSHGLRVAFLRNEQLENSEQSCVKDTYSNSAAIPTN